MLPVPTMNDKPDRLFRYTVSLADLTKADPALAQFTDLQDVGLGQHVTSAGFAPAAIQDTPRMNQVLGLCHDFKIIEPIVGFLSVLVVDRHSLWDRAEEGGGD